MKLLVCYKCNDVFNLSFEIKECTCTAVSGVYRADGVSADVWMPSRKSGAVLGFLNGGFTRALSDQYHKGDPKETMMYGGRVEVKGRDFTAFVIPESASTVHYNYTEENGLQNTE